MRRRRLVLLVSAITLGVLGLLAIATVLFVTRTELGREQVRSFVQPLLANRIQGKVYVGKLGGNFLTEITVDSFAIRDASGELFVSTGPIAVSFNIRDLIDNRIVVRRARVEHPYVHVVQHEDGQWNFKRIFASKDDGPKQPRDPSRRGWGDYVVIDSTWTRGARLLVTQPWHPDEELRGAARDSSIRVHLQNPSKAVTKRADGYGRTYAFANAHGLVRHARINDPDSSATWGRAFIIDTLSVDVYEPTFNFRKISGNFQHLGDTIFIQIPHFDMPASTGSADGKVWWGSNLPMRYAIDITGDSVSLNDVNWVYPTLPKTGGGRMDLRIANDPANLKIIDYHLRDMDVRSTKSHLTGNMSFGTGQRVLLVRNVDLRADPVDFDLMRTLAGGPFPYDWQGQLFGTVRARGGPLTNFVVDDARGTFRDAHVPGAVSRFTARGELDILVPKVTAFHGFDVENAVIDLRTIEYLNKNFPRLGGFIAGRATLDSSWLDVRFSDADITHQNGPGEPSHLTGSGRITYGDVLTYDVNLDAQPLSLTMLARSPTFANMPFRGLMDGPIKAQGEASALDLSTSLQGAAGSLSFDGRVDVDSIGGFGARGSGSFSAINVAAFLEKTNIPTGTFSGRYTADVTGESAPTLRGFVDLSLDSTRVDSVRVHGTRARVEFADGRVKVVDSLRIRTTAGTLTARGGFGLPKGRSDSLFLQFTVDSLGGLRFLTTRDTTVLAAAAAVVDSMSGTAEFVGSLIGTADSFRLVGKASGTDLYINKDRADTAWMTLDLQDLPRASKGVVEARLDSVMLGGLFLDRVGASLALADPKNARFSASALSRNGPLASAIGSWTRAGGDQIVVVDSLGLIVGEDRWQLAQAARVTLDSTKGVRLDSVAFRNRDSALVTLAADVPATGPAFARLRASKVPLMDLGILQQLVDTVRGQLDASVDVTGTKQNPEISATARLSSVLWRSVTIDSARASGTYRTGRFEGMAGVFRKGDTAFAATASLPARVTLFSVRQRDDSIRAELRAKSADLEIVKALMTELGPADVSGRLSGQLKVAGTWRAPVVDGDLGIADGRAFVPQLGVVYTAINGQIRGFRPSATTDSLQINLSASSEGASSGNVIIDGYVKNLLQSRNNQEFDITVDPSNFHVLNKRSTADLYLSLPDRRLFPGDNRIRLRGTTRSPTLTGRLVINRGSIYLADRDIARKQTIEIPVDSATRARSAIIDTLMSNLRVQNVTITLGDDVRMRSAEANVKLSGSLQLQATTNRSRRINAASGAAIPLFDLDGVLLTESGTYSLNLGVVRREFNVLQGGTVTFDGDPNNPLLAIRAQHNVRRPGDRDLGVIVNLHDRLLPYPVIDFTSDADYTIAQSDLISYLLIGRPGFDYAANQPTAQTVMSFLSPTLSALAADQFRAIPGLSSFVDAFQFQLGSSDLSGTSGANFREILTGATIGAEKQFKNVFVSLSTGFCQFHTPGQSFDVGQLLGAKAEWRLLPTKANTALKLSYDPPAASRICGQSSIVGFVNTPGQFGLSFSHSWRF